MLPFIVPALRLENSMRVIVNQQPCEFASDTVNLKALLEHQGVPDNGVAVAING